MQSVQAIYKTSVFHLTLLIQAIDKRFNQFVIKIVSHLATRVSNDCKTSIAEQDKLISRTIHSFTYRLHFRCNHADCKPEMASALVLTSSLLCSQYWGELLNGMTPTNDFCHKRHLATQGAWWSYAGYPWLLQLFLDWIRPRSQSSFTISKRFCCVTDH